ncbi:MAG: methionyl-tRNA formyltransferase [Lachnospiraceae bacterium]|nr:methionyl-tRNA formyltransferase [Lachnospiraceae bacterium]
MKIIFMGTPDFAVNSLEAINDAGHEITLVVTQPDKPKGRSGALQMSDVKQCALKLGIPVYQPEKIKDPAAFDKLKEYECELIVVAAFGQIIPEEILKFPKYGCINVHASLLPRLRGASPIQTAILEGDAETGVTIQQMGVGLDTGDILSQSRIPIDKDDTGGSLFDKLADLGAELVVKTIEDIGEGRIRPCPQDEDKASYAKKIDKSMGRIDWNMDACEIERLIRALDPWPSAFSSLEGRMVKIWKAQTVPGTDAAPGRVTDVRKDGISVACGSGLLIIKEIQLEGKKRMPVHDFLLGYDLKPGALFS